MEPKNADDKNLGGRPEFEPTDDQRRLVQELAGLRVPQKHIARLIVKGGIAIGTLVKHFAEELEVGHMHADLKLRKVQYDLAVNKRDRTMLIWLGKQFLDQREPQQEHKHSGQLTLTSEDLRQLSDEQLAQLADIHAALAAARAGAGGDPPTQH